MRQRESALRSPATVVSKQAAQPLVALDLTVSLANFVARLDDPVCKTLVVPFAMIVNQEFANRVEHEDI
jgi:hypothetical protein